MIQRKYSALEKRALNQVCNGAGRYGFVPPFLALTPSGEPDLYLNTMIGLAVRWFNLEKLTAFFRSYEGSLRYEELDVIVWLGLENCLYAKELPFRPVLKALRRKHAEEFIKRYSDLSRQESMALSMRVHEQREYRWNKVLGRRLPLLGSSARQLAENLELHADLDTENAIAVLRRILETYFHLRSSSVRSAGGFTVSRRIGALLQKIMYRETKHTDSLMLRFGTAEQKKTAPVRLLSRGQLALERSEADDAYVRACFGRQIFSPREMDILNAQLCVGAHEYCRLYLAGIDAGDKAAAASLKGRDRKEVMELQKDIAAQADRSRKYFERNAMQISSGVRSLTAALDTVLSTYREPLPERSARGRLESARSYRIPLFRDKMVFTHPGDEAEHRIHIDLLLDASASRMNYQEMIASQTYVIARSLENLHVPVRVMAFRSLRGYTVLQQLKSYADKSLDGLFHYYAAGWNRDSLALSVMNRLIHENTPEFQSFEHVLFILTDASPDDSVHMPPAEGSLFGRAYHGADAVKDTAEMVRIMRQNGVHTVAVYLGSTAHADNVRYIYGNEFVSVRNIETLASRVGSLLQMTLTELKR